MSSKYNKILDIIYSAIEEVNRQQPPEYTLKKGKEEFLISDKSSIDSLGLINNKNDKFIFCHPYDGHNKNTLEIINDYNFDVAFTIEVGLINCEKNMLELLRVDTNDLPKLNTSKISKWIEIVKNG